MIAKTLQETDFANPREAAAEAVRMLSGSAAGADAKRAGRQWIAEAEEAAKGMAANDALLLLDSYYPVFHLTYGTTPDPEFVRGIIMSLRRPYKRRRGHRSLHPLPRRPARTAG